ncbi:hypothetical protein QBC35DRAFT_487909 [Podospora australis]|uniref:Uncharacterized protein n=1 Tax=Podospora australis TaxID=1536484 RepID=A0AAN6X3A8_9PEZI|nr:hypothetical protein QBC35DRAFT_487909 [Podospora australis]
MHFSVAAAVALLANTALVSGAALSGFTGKPSPAHSLNVPAPVTKAANVAPAPAEVTRKPITARQNDLDDPPALDPLTEDPLALDPNNPFLPPVPAPTTTPPDEFSEYCILDDPKDCDDIV